MSAFAILIAGALAAGPAAAQGKKPDTAVDTVRYSYQKWSRAGAARYVLEPLPTRVDAKTFEDRVRALFKGLVGAKQGSYGKAALAFKADAAKSGVVYVYLDAEKAKYNPIVMAETTYTFTENGASRVIFPKVAEKGWTRDDVPFAAYELVVPLWEVLPPDGIAGALVKLPSGSLLTATDARARLAKGDKALIDAAWSAVKTGPNAAALAAVKAAPLMNLADLEQRLIPVLQSANTALRGAALEGLDGRDNKAVNAALRKVMDADPDAALRDKAAAMLSVSKDPAFSTAAQYHALRSKDPKVVAQAAKGLGQSPVPEAGAQLVKTLGHPAPEVRTVVIAALIERKDHAALVKALENQELALAARIEMARALAGDKDKGAAHEALQFLAVQAKGDDAAGAAARLATFDEPASYVALGKALKHAEAPTRRAAASALARLGDPKGLPLLAAADGKDPESGEAMHSAMRVIYSKQSLDFVMKGTKESNPALKQQAVATLGKLVETPAGKRSRKAIVKALEPLASASDPLIRAAAARSYEAMAGDDVKAKVIALAGDKAVEVRRSAAHALRAFPGKEATTLLLGFTESKDPEVLANAIESVGVLKIVEALDRVVGNKDDKDARVRRAVTGALVEIGKTLPEDKRKPLLSAFSEKLFDKDAQVRMRAVEGLRLVKDPKTVVALAALLKDPDKGVRQATLNAMASTGEASAVETIATGLEDDDAEVRRTAILALGVLKQKAAKKVLMDYAKGEKDGALAAEARKVAGAL